MKNVQELHIFAIVTQFVEGLSLKTLLTLKVVVKLSKTMAETGIASP
jgi:hypothetical protein